MIIKNSYVFTEEGKFEREDIFINGEFFSDNILNTKDQEIIDGQGYYAIPGLIDIHFHGANGYDFCDGTEEAIKAIADYELKNGITTICPATMTLGLDKLAEISKAAANYNNHCGAELIGINMEGPFISESKKGAQDSKYIKSPDIDDFRELQNLSEGLYKLVTIAPELDGTMEFIKELKDEVAISIGHTSANYSVAMKAFENGAKQVTHLYNAMTSFSHREPGIVGAAFDNDNVMVELICDGVHVHPSIIRSTFKTFGEDRIILISDSMRATGLSDGKYELGGQKVQVNGNKATLINGGAIAGSVTNLMDCFRYAVKEACIPLESVVKASTKNPAKAIDIYDKYGSISNRKYANLILLDKDLNIIKIIYKGKLY